MNVDEGTTNSQEQENSDATSVTEVISSPTETTEENKTLIEGEKPEAIVEEFVPLTAEDITFPEGLEVSDTRRDEALAIVNNRELSPKDQLQALVNLQGEVAKEASETISNTWAETQKEWQDAVKADPTIGGDKLPATLSAVSKLVTEYADDRDKLTEVFAMTGAGNNVHVIKFLNNVAGKLLEGTVVSATAPSNQGEDRAARMFPSMQKG